MPPEVSNALAAIPPWLVLSLLLGVMNGAACFVLFGKKLSRIGWYVAIGALAAGVGQVFGMAVSAPSPLSIGQLNLAVASLAAWIVLGTARGLGL